MTEGKNIFLATGAMLFFGGLIVLPYDMEAALVLETLASTTFVMEKLMARQPKREIRRFHIINMKDGSEVVRDV